ncbi:Ig domain-containing protein [Rhizobium leucaenae]|uniref:Dystroglycan-type cadherin-like domain-containing protein n=1 Tax=Rhizobium leucaenae TaxID=29450 RepID=A0A7W6ZV23_9HYPH|nr:Ig domain-containing protein [Rhizobium leucaenae]MBB4569241.1 hypothetical protein [Rhizobium leucaenae]
MRRIPLTAAIAMLLATSASADEPRILWRSATTGTITAPVTAEPPPVVAPGPLSISYDGNGRTFPRGTSMSLAPTIDGGSEQYEFAFANGNTLPAGVVFNSATGVFSGQPLTTGDFTFNILVHDTQSGQYVTSVVRFFIA